MRDEFTVMIAIAAMFIIFGMTQAYKSKDTVSWKTASTKLEAVCDAKSYWKKFIPSNK